MTNTSNSVLEHSQWTSMADRQPPDGITFVMTSLMWKDRQYVVKKQWTQANHRNNAKNLSSLFWIALPGLPENKTFSSEEKSQ